MGRYRSPSPGITDVTRRLIDLALKDASERERFLSLIQRRELDECWYWQGSLYGQTGYGRISFRLPGENSFQAPAHVVSYLIHGGELPKGHVVRHLCPKDFSDIAKNRRCVNPAHLRNGTPQQNTHDALRDGTFPIGSGRSYAKLTEEDIEPIIDRLLAGEEKKAIAGSYRVTSSTLDGLIKRVSWKHVDIAEWKFEAARAIDYRRLSHADVESIFDARMARQPLHSIGQRYGINATNVHGIIHRIYYSDAPVPEEKIRAAQAVDVNADRRKLTDADIPVILSLRAQPWSQQRIANHFGVSRELVREILKGSRHGGKVAASAREAVEGIDVGRKLSDADVERVFDLCLAGYGIQKIAHQFQVNDELIRMIIRGERQSSAPVSPEKRARAIAALESRVPRAKALTTENVLQTVELCILGMSTIELGERFGVSPTTIRNAIVGTTYRSAPVHPNRRALAVAAMSARLGRLRTR